MNFLLIYAHPQEDSFNAAMRDSAINTMRAANHQITLSDLYQENFNPVLMPREFDHLDHYPGNLLQAQKQAYNLQAFHQDVAQEQAKLQAADVIIFQFPLWWFSVPAILKGWFDRVFAKGFAYDAGKMFAQGLLTGKKTMLALTTQSPESAFKAQGLHGDMQQLLNPIHHTLRFVGMEVLPPFIAYSVAAIEDEQRRRYLDQYQEHLKFLLKEFAV